MTTWSRSRTLVVATFAALTFGLGLLPGPTLAQEADPGGINGPAPVFVGEAMDGVYAFRPAALLRRAETTPGPLSRMLTNLMRDGVGEVFAAFGVVTDRADAPRLQPREIEWLSFGFRIGKGGKPDRPLHQLVVEGLAFRTVEPFDAADFLRRWGIELAEAHEAGRPLSVGKIKGFPFAVHQPNDRTVILGTESEVRAAIAGTLKTPAFLQGPDWEQARRGLLAAVVTNPDGRLTKGYDLGRPDDAVVLALLDRVERWTIRVDDAAVPTLHAIATARDDQAATALAVKVAGLRLLGKQAFPDGKPADSRTLALAWTALDRLRARAEGTSVRVDVDAGPEGTWADVGALVAEMQQMDEEIKKLDADVKKLDDLTNGPEAVADRARYQREMAEYEQKHKKYLEEQEDFRAGRSLLPPVPPVQPVPPL